MEMNKPRASIHVGADKKSFSAQMGNEAERRDWGDGEEQPLQLLTQASQL